MPKKKAADCKRIHVSSAVFENSCLICPKYNCDGLNINPLLNLKDITGDEKFLFLIVDDSYALTKT